MLFIDPELKFTVYLNTNKSSISISRAMGNKEITDGEKQSQYPVIPGGNSHGKYGRWNSFIENVLVTNCKLYDHS